MPLLKAVERTHKLATPEHSPAKSPAKTSERDPSTGLTLLGGLRKPTLLLSPGGTPASKSFGADASLPTLSATLTRSSVSPKKGRGRPRKQDKGNSRAASPDLFRSVGGNDSKSTSAAVPASFLQYRGPPGEVGSDSDSRCSSSSSGWSQSCSSCTHYDDGSDRAGSLSGSDRSSDNDTMESTLEGASGTERRSTRRNNAADLPDADQLTVARGRGTRSSSARSPVKTSSHPDLQLEPLQLVWAKCRGYPWYPALIIDPKIPKGFIYNGVPLPVPPVDVLNLKKNHAHEPVLYLVLFFDVKRTWQWLPPNKLEPLGLEKNVDQAKLVESRKPADRKAVKKAYEDAMMFRKQVDGDK